MSADLLAEFDSFYQAPSKDHTNAPTASHDLSLLSDAIPATQPAFGASKWQNQTTQQSADIWGSVSSTQPSLNHTNVNTNQDDGWGSFEAFAEPAPAPKQLISQAFTPMTGNYGTGSGSAQPGYNGGIVKTNTPDLFSWNVNTIESLPHLPTPIAKDVAPRPPVPTSRNSYGEVLFDAGDEMNSGFGEDDDDFGDFETVTSPPPPTAPPPSSQSLDKLFGSIAPEPKRPIALKAKPASLLPASVASASVASASLRSPSLTSPSLMSPSLSSPNLTSPGLPYPQAPKSPSFQERNPFGQQMSLAMNQVAAAKQADKQTSASPITVWPSLVTPQIKRDDNPYEDSPVVNNDEDEDWGDFSDMPAQTPSTNHAVKNKPTSGIEADAWGWDDADGVTTKPVKATNDVPPPSNIPPPSIILTLFPALFDLPQTTLFKGVVNQSFSLKNRILSDPSTVNFLRGYLLIATVAARVVAGRKLRWKRDTILSQSMKIGQAAAGGKGGMKLAGVDKAEVTREDREAAEVVRVWKDQLGRLKSAVAVANTSIKNTSQHLQIPDITDVMHVKLEAGGLKAPKPCVLCGLKREERVQKVDITVEDSFGEWWVDHWGHRACKNLWEEHESKLKHH
ncbi:hypothetical protein GLAREA_12970 [Glarea lozoyensis ATCC 20868]|uniref:Serine/threonine-protein kinase ppk6 n=1 Tax=Glarea lozoyensis (strain ATCC 20868 / MF5171) TaxID=1116229 RepID=S3CV23_GLAL2|nr:uncharacterized protein GLAREA_12970 [Glarea lozoyensis ATCC 20868]EPE30247.1 hypothetical protein GLAREA_12970 [Glarea lozoyensis ATCC 20868]